MKTADIPFNKITITGDEHKHIKNVLSQNSISGDGIYTKKSSEIIKKLTNSQKVLLTHSCTGALEMAAILCNLQAGDEVIMPSFTFVSTANAVVLRGATQFSLILNLKCDARCSKVERDNRSCKAIFAVHYASCMFGIDTLRKFAMQTISC